MLCVIGGYAVSIVYGSPSSNIEENTSDSTAENETTKTAGSSKIDPDEAKRIMDSGEAYVLLDVRSTEEFTEEHIVGALSIPGDEIAKRAPVELPNKEALIMVYCRSGVRSSAAVNELTEMGYTNVRDLGGIIDWPYETVAKTTP
jgi:rhodanese-related sulfurtransferase